MAKTQQEYYELIMKEMRPITDVPAVHALAVAIHNYVALKMAEYDEEVEKKRAREAAERLRLEAKKEEDEDSGFLTIIKIAVLGAVAVFAPPLLSGALPCIGVAGSVSNAITTGVTVGTADALVQGAAIALHAQGKFSLNEVLESAISAGVASGVGQAPILTQGASASASAAATQAAEIAIGTRKEFNLADVALQGAAAIVAASIREAVPGLTEKFGSEQAAKIVTSSANAAIGAVLQTTVTGAPISLQSIAMSVLGNTAAEKIVSTVRDVITPTPAPASQETPTLKQEEPPQPIKPNLDKVCLINDKPIKNPYTNMTPIDEPLNLDDYKQLVAQGKLDEARRLLDKKAAKYLPPADEPQPSVLENPRLKSLLEKTYAEKYGTDPDTTSKILQNLLGGKTSNEINQAQEKIPDIKPVTSAAPPTPAPSPQAAPKEEVSLFKEYRKGLTEDFLSFSKKFNYVPPNAEALAISMASDRVDPSLRRKMAHLDDDWQISKPTREVVLTPVDLTDPDARTKMKARLAVDLTEELLKDAVLTEATAGIGVFLAKGAMTLFRVTKTVENTSRAGTLFTTAERVTEGERITAAFAKYPKQVEQYSKLTSNQLEKAMISHEKQIVLHQSKLKNPKSYVPNWEQLSAEHQQNLIHHWEQDISRHKSYFKIAEAILKKNLEEVPKNGR